MALSGDHGVWRARLRMLRVARRWLVAIVAVLALLAIPAVVSLNDASVARGITFRSCCVKSPGNYYMISCGLDDGWWYEDLASDLEQLEQSDAA